MKQGFTLIEMLVVVLIIGILSAIAIPQFTTAIEKTRVTEALITAKAIKDAAQRYYQANPNETTPICHWYQIADVDLKANQWAIGKAATGGCDSYRTQTFTYELGSSDLNIYRVDRANPVADNATASNFTDAPYQIIYPIPPSTDSNTRCHALDPEYTAICTFITNI